MVLWMEESLHHSIYPILQDLQRLGDPRGFKISSIHRRGPQEDARCSWGNIRAILGLYGDNGKESGNYYLGFKVFGYRRGLDKRVYRGY